MALGTTLPFGLRQVRLTPFTDLTCTVYAGSSIALPNSQVFSFTEAEDFEDLRGDDALQTSHGKGPVINWELTAGGISLDAYQALAGGATPITTGTTPNQIKTYDKLVTDARLCFKAEGRAISDNGGDMHCIVFRCKTTGDIEGKFEDGTFFLTSAKGVGYGSLVPADLNKLYRFAQNETPAVIS